MLNTCAGSTITQNTVINNEGRGIWQIVHGAGVIIPNNTEKDNRVP